MISERPWDSENESGISTDCLTTNKSSTSVFTIRDFGKQAYKLGLSSDTNLNQKFRDSNYSVHSKRNDFDILPKNDTIACELSFYQYRLRNYYLIFTIRTLRKYISMLIFCKIIFALKYFFFYVSRIVSSSIPFNLLGELSLEVWVSLVKLIIVIGVTSFYFGLFLLIRSNEGHTVLSCMQSIFPSYLQKQYKSLANNSCFQLIRLHTSFVRKWIFRIWLSGIAVTSTTLALNLVIPNEFDIINCVVLGLIVALRIFYHKWDIYLTEFPISQLERIILVLFYFIIPSYIICFIFPFFGEIIQAAGTLLILPNMPLLLFTKATVFPTHFVIGFIITIHRVFIACIVNYIVFSCIDFHDSEMRKLYHLSFFKSAREFEIFMTTSKYDFHRLSFFKMILFSNNAPSELPIKFHFIKTENDTVVTFPGFHPPETYTKNQSIAFEDADSFNIPPDLKSIPIAFSNPLKNNDTESILRSTYTNESINTVSSNVFLHNFPLMNSTQEYKPFQMNTHYIENNDFLKNRKIYHFLKTYNIFIFWEERKKYFWTMLSDMMKRIIPKQMVNFLLSGSLKSNDQLSRILFTDFDPAIEFGVDQGLICYTNPYASKGCSSQDNSLVLNYWVYSILLDLKKNKIWSSYVQKGVEILDVLTHIINVSCKMFVLEPFKPSSTPNNHSSNTVSITKYKVPLELLITLNNIFKLLQKLFDSSDCVMQIPTIQSIILSLNEVNQIKTDNHSEIRLSPPKNNEDVRLYKISEDFSIEIEKKQFNKLIQESNQILNKTALLSIFFCIGFSQWCHVAQLLQQHAIIRNSLRQVSPIILRLYLSCNMIESLMSVPHISIDFYFIRSIMEVCKIYMRTISDISLRNSGRSLYLNRLIEAQMA